MIPQENGKSMTARDLAKLIGVSQSAISRAFTPGASISGELRERILSSARMLGYRPNAIASILSRRKSDMVPLWSSQTCAIRTTRRFSKSSREDYSNSASKACSSTSRPAST